MQIKMKLASESHVPRFRAGVGTWRSGYMIPIRLPWRHRARPSATLHEIPVCPEEQTCLYNATWERGARQEGVACVGAEWCCGHRTQEGEWIT